MLLCEQLKSSSVRLDVSEEVVWVQGEVGAQAEVGAQGEIVKRRFGGESKDTECSPKNPSREALPFVH